MLTVAPLAMAPSAHWNPVAVAAHVPADVVGAPTRGAPAGRVSFSVTPAAANGPLFVTCMK